MCYPQLWIKWSSAQCCQKCREECIDLIYWFGTVIFDFSISLMIYYFGFYSSQELISSSIIPVLCSVMQFSEASCFLNFSSILTNYFHSISYTAFPPQQLLSHNTFLSKQVSEELSLWPVPRGRRRAGAGCSCPGNAAAHCACLFPSTLLLSAPVKQKGEAQAVLPAPAAISGLLPRDTCRPCYIFGNRLIGQVTLLSFSYSENYVVTIVFQWGVLNHFAVRDFCI